MVFHVFNVGTDDSLIRHDWGLKTAANLLIREIQVQFTAYDGVDHEISDREVCF